MKRIVILLVLILLTGCSKHAICTIDTTNENMDYKLSAKYDIYYKGKYVTKIVKKEIYTTENKDTYNYLDKAKEVEYSMMSSAYGGYTYTIDKKRDSIVIEATIDVSKLDVEALVKDKKIDKYYTAKQEILVSGLKKHYESKNAICK